MNPELLRAESDHVRAEQRKLRELLGIEEQAIRLLVADLLALRRAVALADGSSMGGDGGRWLHFPDEAWGQLNEAIYRSGDKDEAEMIDEYIAEAARRVFRKRFDTETAAALPNDGEEREVA